MMYYTYMKKTYIALSVLCILILLVIIATAHYGYKKNTGLVGCTGEALMCPDGSGVERGGPGCRFAACPDYENMGPIVGVLLQNSNGFRLVLDAPTTTGQEVSYALPLEIKVSNALTELVNKKVKVFGTFSEGNTLVVDRLEELQGVEGDRTLGAVKVGQTVFIDGVRITLNSITRDNRCPANANCIVMGGITVSVTLKSDTDQETLTMASDEIPTPFDAYRISIVDVAPVMIAGERAALESYVVTFKVIPL